MYNSVQIFPLFCLDDFEIGRFTEGENTFLNDDGKQNIGMQSFWQVSIRNILIGELTQ